MRRMVTVSTAMRLAKSILITAEISALGWLAATEDLSAPGLALLGAVAAIAVGALTLFNWPFGAVAVLVASSAMPTFTGTVFGLHVHAEHIAIAFVMAAALLQVSQRRTRAALHLQRFDCFLIAYIVLNFVTSAVTSPEPRMTIRWATLHAIVIIPYFLVRWLVKDESGIHKAFHIVLWVGAVESVYGTICFLSNQIFNTAFGVEVGQYGRIPGTYGTQYEANLFGSYTACCALMFFTMFLLTEKSKSRYGWGFVVSILGSMVSLSRAVMLAFPIVALIVVWIALKRGRLQVRTLVSFAAAFAISLMIVSPLILGFVRERFSTIDLSEISADNTAASRIIQMAVAVEDVRSHPVFGTGTASFQLLFDWDDYVPSMKADKDAGAWVGNTPLRILHDTGLVGLAIFLMFIGSLAFAARRAIRLAGPRTAAILISLQIGLLLYAITFQSTEASLLAFTWVHVGCLAATVTILQLNRAAGRN